MSYVGMWKFHSVGMVNEDFGLEYFDAESFLKAPMPYIDEDDPEAVADELKERKLQIGSKIEICDDGKLYMLMPIPEGVPQDEVDAAVAAGQINVRNGMLTDSPVNWEIRDGALWAELDSSEDGFVDLSADDGLIAIMTIRYEKEQ